MRREMRGVRYKEQVRMLERSYCQDLGDVD